jgi:uncharacterized protein
MVTQWVIKVSKFCNLRCDYCYEFPELGNRARMSQEDASAMFANMAAFYAHQPETQVQCVWHGGEPLLQEPGYFHMLLAEQKRWLGGLDVRNVVQTNLTVLDESRIALLRDRFDGVGVSVDLFGNHRLNLAGRPSQDRVLANLDRLQEAKVRFGCITVLTRRTIPHLESIFRFYERANLSFRVLPLFRGATNDQNAGFQVGAREVLDALCRLFDLWLASPTHISVAPLSDLLAQLVRRRAGDEPDYYDRRHWEEVVVVNTNGDLYADADAYLPGRSWGNIFKTPLTELLGGAEWERSVRDAELRMAAVCTSCEYFGACTGYAVAEDSRDYDDCVDSGGRRRCIVERGVCAHIERRLDEAGADGRIDAALWSRSGELLGLGV